MLTVKFRSKLWLYPGPGGWPARPQSGWHFITLPVTHAKTIKSLLLGTRRAWGSLPVKATIGKSSWKTSVFPDKKSNSYVLPVKADVRKKENLEDGDTISVTLQVSV